VGETTDVGTISHVIQLSVAPVFLLLGVGSILSVMTNRLSRIIDRARVLEAQLEDAPAGRAVHLQADLATLTQRARLIGPAITLCTATALMVCIVIAVLFCGAFLQFDPTLAVALLFVAGMVSFFFGLLWFLREIFVATSNLRIGSRWVHSRKAKP
jgi:Protein of unknown function (DUF2721)